LWDWETLSIPIELLVYVLAQGPWNVALESGTYRGEGAPILARYVNHVWAIQPVPAGTDNSDQQLGCAELHHVQILTGRSDEVLADLLPKIDEPAIIWLGPHPERTASEARQFTVREIERISQWEHAAGSCILIQGAVRPANAPSYPVDQDARWPIEADLKVAVARCLPGHQAAVCDGALILLPGRNFRHEIKGT
jgi:hypothetical protein